MHARIGWQNLRTTEFLEDGKYLLITGTDFVDGKIDFTRCYYVKQERYNQDRNIQIKNGCILITKDGTLGKVAYVNGLNKQATLNAGIFNVEIRDENKVDRLYLYQYIKAPFLLEYVNQMATGGTIKHLNQNILVDFMVSMPQSMEQKKIGELFQILDHLITLHQRKLEKLKIIKKSMLENLFPQNGEKTPKIRLSGFTKDWEQRKVGAICSISTGKSNTQDRVEDGKYPFYVRSSIVERSNRYLFDEEAVLTVGDGVGTGKVFHYVDGKYDLHQRVYRMFGFERDISAKYFFYYFSNNFYDRVMAMTAKTSVDSVRHEMIADMDIIVPCIKEQKFISGIFQNFDHLITLHQSKFFGDVLKTIASYTLSWEQRKLGEIGSVAMCRRVFKYQTTESGDIPFFKIGSFGATPDAFISKDLFENLKIKYPYPEKGDVLISASGSIGRTVVFTGKDEYFQDSNIVWLKHDNSIINPFLNYLYSIVKWIGIEGTTIKRLYNDNILKTEVIIPTLSEQQKISNYLDGIDHLITLHQLEPFKLIFKAIAYRIIDYAKSKPPRYIKYEDII